MIAPLVEYGAELDEPRDDGTTPLIYAARNGYLESVVALLEAGASREVRGPGGRTALQAARRHGNATIASVLEKERDEWAAHLELARRRKIDYRRGARRFNALLAARKRWDCESWDRPVLLHAPTPGFAEEAAAEGLSGRIDVGFVVPLDGRPEWLGIDRPTGINPWLNRVALETVAGLRFRPARCDGAPVEVILWISFSYGDGAVRWSPVLPLNTPESTWLDGR